MSERMIELRRAKMGLPQMATTPSVSASPSARQNNTSSSAGGSKASSSKTPSSSGRTGKQIAALTPPPGASLVIPLTPQQAAIAAMREEDRRMQHFIHCLQYRDDATAAAPSISINSAAPLGSGDKNREQQSRIITPRGPTVPTALSRRMLHRQGAGYLDDTVAAIVSASADQFLATVLQQAMACREQRLKGTEMARNAARHRKRHIQHYEEDRDDRKRRKEQLEGALQKAHLTAIATGEALAKSKAEATKKKRKKPTESVTMNGKKAAELAKLRVESDEESYDSIDEEEDYYNSKLGPVDERLLRKRRDEDDDEEDENDMLLLKDLALPLEAWDFHVIGKYGLDEPLDDDDSDSTDDAEKDDDENDNVQDDTATAAAVDDDDAVDSDDEDENGDANMATDDATKDESEKKKKLATAKKKATATKKKKASTKGSPKAKAPSPVPNGDTEAPPAK